MRPLLAVVLGGRARWPRFVTPICLVPRSEMRSLGRRGAKLPEERASDAEAAREAALGMLDRARRTRSDLAGRLREKGYVPAVVEQVIERLVAVGLLDDVEYA